MAEHRTGAVVQKGLGLAGVALLVGACRGTARVANAPAGEWCAVHVSIEADVSGGSDEFLAAKQAYTNERWDLVPRFLEPVLQGKTADDKAHVDEAQFMLAVAAFRSSEQERAQAMFTAIARGATHSRRGSAASWLCAKFGGEGSDRLAATDRVLLAQREPPPKRRQTRGPLPPEIREDEEKLRAMTAALGRVGPPDLAAAGKAEVATAGAALRAAVKASRGGDGDEMVAALAKFDLSEARFRAVLDGKMPCEVGSCAGAEFCCWNSKACFGTCESSFEACEATGPACRTEDDCPRGNGVIVNGCEPAEGEQVSICRYRFLRSQEADAVIERSTNEANAWDRDCGPDSVRADPAACARRCAAGDAEACGRVCSEGADPVKRAPTCQKLCRQGEESGCKLACSESPAFCNAQCRSGLLPACEAADEQSREVGERVAAGKARVSAEGKLPALFQQCEANRDYIFKWKKAWIAARRTGDEARTQEAAEKIAEIQPKWGGTLGEIREAIRAATGDQGPRFQQFVRDVSRRCSLPSWAGFVE